jgi:hypothetical protein
MVASSSMIVITTVGSEDRSLFVVGTD